MYSWKKALRHFPFPKIVRVSLNHELVVLQPFFKFVGAEVACIGKVIEFLGLRECVDVAFVFDGYVFGIGSEAIQGINELGLNGLPRDCKCRVVHHLRE